MKALLLCDHDSASYFSQDLRAKVQAAVTQAGCDVEIVDLNGDEIKPCLGCFDCWLKTPGLCTQTHDCVNTICEKQLQSSVVIFLSKITYGGLSYDMKAFVDRSIPNIMPFLRIVGGETHHQRRYDKFTCMVTIGYGECTASEQSTFVELAERNARSMRPRKHFNLTIQNADETDATMESLKNALISEVPR